MIIIRKIKQPDMNEIIHFMHQHKKLFTRQLRINVLSSITLFALSCACFKYLTCSREIYFKDV